MPYIETVDILNILMYYIDMNNIEEWALVSGKVKSSRGNKAHQVDIIIASGRIPDGCERVIVINKNEYDKLLIKYNELVNSLKPSLLQQP